MQRRTAVAAASAISMSLAAAAITIGANLGALGFAASTPAPVAPPSAAIATTPAQSPSQGSATTTGSNRSTASEREHESPAAVPTVRSYHDKETGSDE
jgi:hypothetical protein